MRILTSIAAAAMIIPGAAMAQTTGGGTTTGGTTTGGTASRGSTTAGMNNGMSTGTIDQANPPTSTDGSTTSTDPQSVSKARGRTRGSTSRSAAPGSTTSGTASDTMGTGTAGSAATGGTTGTIPPR